MLIGVKLVNNMERSGTRRTERIKLHFNTRTKNPTYLQKIRLVVGLPNDESMRWALYVFESGRELSSTSSKVAYIN